VELPSIPSGTSLRMDCPRCGGRNTLSITNKSGKVIWYCFRASCHTSGLERVKRSPDDLAEALLGDKRVEATTTPWEMPPHFVSPYNNKQAMEYLERNNCTYAFQQGLARIRYDAKQHRVVFLIYYGGKLKGGVGRALYQTREPALDRISGSRKPRPKWFRYGNSGYPFICGTSERGVLTEDAASSCAAAATNYYSGCALLGTNLLDEYIPIINQLYKELIICLDRDASTLAVNMHKQLSAHLPTKVIIPPDDLKYFKPDTICRILGKDKNGKGIASTTTEKSVLPESEAQSLQGPVP
jgi:hypothetical protein